MIRIKGKDRFLNFLYIVSILSDKRVGFYPDSPKSIQNQENAFLFYSGKIDILIAVSYSVHVQLSPDMLRLSIFPLEGTQTELSTFRGENFSLSAKYYAT